jgi:hypothetical protein
MQRRSLLGGRITSVGAFLIFGPVLGAQRNFSGALDEPESMLLTLSPTFWLPLRLGNTIADLAPNSIASITLRCNK